jgi:hypothetical protein
VNEPNEKCATLTLPSLPALPAVPEGTNSGSARLAGFGDAREHPGQPNDPEEDRWLVGYRINRMNSTVLLGGFNPALTEVLKPKRWATLVRGEGWVIPLRYLEHVERLLFGADVDLFDVDGAPTPVQREREQLGEKAHAAQVLAEIQQAKEQQSQSPAAYRAARQAFAAAVAAAQPVESDEAVVAS